VAVATRTKTHPDDLPRYVGDEKALGLTLALALHVVPLAMLAKAGIARADIDAPPPSPPVIAASLLKLGAPRDPAALPQRFVPQERTVKARDVVASREDPAPRVAPKSDAGPPPKDGKEADLDNLIAHSDPFAEHAAQRPELGGPLGRELGTQTDPALVREGDAYATTLEEFFRQQWELPTVISPGDARKLCAVFRVRINGDMHIGDVTRDAVKSSGSELFDDSVRSMLMKLLEREVPLPMPPQSQATNYRNATVELTLTGDPQGDATRCRR
jgi:hypothetical protein